MNADGSEVARLGRGGVPAWSPDGERFAFTWPDDPTAQQPEANVWVANTDGTGRTQLTPGFAPAWSPDGERIAFARNGDIWAMDPDGANQIRLARGSTPDWQPLPAGSSLGPPPSQFCFEALRRNVSRGIARLVVEVPRPGRVVLQRRPGVRRAVRAHDGEGKGRVILPVRARVARSGIQDLRSSNLMLEGEELGEPVEYGSRVDTASPPRSAPFTAY